MISKIQRVDIRQGDSLNPSYTFSVPSYVDLSSEDWIGRYVIRKGGLKGSVLLQRDLGKSTDFSKFVFTIDPLDSATLIVGNHFLIIEIKNMNLDIPFRQEIVQCPINVSESGIL